jgi:antirestriction protein ArdC
VNEQRELADRVLASLRAGTVPWRFPHNRLPEFAPLFGKFFTGEPLTEAEVNYGEAEAIIAATGAKVSHHWRVKKPRCERPPRARILLPPKSRFINDAQYIASKLHELIHYVEAPWFANWVGPADRGEMIAEVGTGFLESHLRLPHDQDNTNILKWLPKWIEGIRADSAYLFDAVAQAERSVNYLLDLRREKAAA